MAASQAKMESAELRGPAPQEGAAVVLRTSAVLTAAWIATEPISVKGARKLTLYIAYDADAGGTANRPQMTLWGSAEDSSTAPGEAPAVGDDVWYAPGIIDVAPSDAILTGTPVTGFDATVQPEYRGFTIGPLSLTLFASDAGTDKIRVALTVDVTPYRWFHLQAKELGDTDADQLGILGVKYNLSL